MSEKKLQAARKAAEFVKDGMVLGLGTGSTTRLAVDEIGKLVSSGYKLVGHPHFGGDRKASEVAGNTPDHPGPGEGDRPDHRRGG